MIKSCFLNGKFNDYTSHWGWLNVKGKRVMDIGADMGSTADYFIDRGAKMVYAIEGWDVAYKILLKNSRIPELRGKIIPTFYFINSALQIENLILTHEPQVMKIDCEGGEAFLPEVNKDVLLIPEAYGIETHKNEDRIKIISMMTEIGFKLDKEIVCHANMSLLHFKR